MVRCINLDAGEPPASDGTNFDLADARGPARTPKQRRILASGKKMALGNGSTPPPDPRVHPEHRFRRRAGMAAGSPSTGTNRFRPSITQLIELSDGCILMVWCIKLNS